MGPPDVARSPFGGVLHQNDIIMTNLRMTFMTLRDDDTIYTGMCSTVYPSLLLCNTAKHTANAVT